MLILELVDMGLSWSGVDLQTTSKHFRPSLTTTTTNRSNTLSHSEPLWTASDFRKVQTTSSHLDMCPKLSPKPFAPSQTWSQLCMIPSHSITCALVAQKASVTTSKACVFPVCGLHFHIFRFQLFLEISSIACWSQRKHPSPRILWIC